MLEGLRRHCTSKQKLSIWPSLPKRYFHVTFIWLQYLTISRQFLSLRLSDYRLVITSPGANNCMSYKTLKCLTIVRVILLKLTVVKSLKLKKNTEYTQTNSDKIRIRYFAACCLFIFILKGKSTIYLLKISKSWKPIRSGNAWENYPLEREILSVSFDLFFVHKNNS